MVALLALASISCANATLGSWNIDNSKDDKYIFFM